MSAQSKVQVKTYKGTQQQANDAFQRDVSSMAEKGYFPTAQSWAPGAYGCGAFLVALLLCLILIGILVFIYMLIVKPDGTLSVTYEFRSLPTPAREHVAAAEKTCPKCAEQVKVAATICRFCGHEFPRP